MRSNKVQLLEIAEGGANDEKRKKKLSPPRNRLADQKLKKWPRRRINKSETENMMMRSLCSHNKQMKVAKAENNSMHFILSQSLFSTNDLISFKDHVGLLIVGLKQT